jgi:hypothetical protein
LCVSLPARAERINTVSIDIPDRIEAVHLFTHKGQDYHLTKLIDSRKIGKVKYFSFEVLDSNYPLRISNDEYLQNEEVLKSVPDFRPENQAHPYKHGAKTLGPHIFNAGVSILGMFL